MASTTTLKYRKTGIVRRFSSSKPQVGSLNTFDALPKEALAEEPVQVDENVYLFWHLFGKFKGGDEESF